MKIIDKIPESKTIPIMSLKDGDCFTTDDGQVYMIGRMPDFKSCSRYMVNLKSGTIFEIRQKKERVLYLKNAEVVLKHEYGDIQTLKQLK